MVKINNNIVNIDEANSFMSVSKMVSDYKRNNSDKKKILSLSIGDVSKPIVKPIIKAMHQAVDDLSDMSTFHGYGASNGYAFLKKAILDNEYKSFGFGLDEIYISNGTKSDSTNILELFDINSKIAISDIMYPIYKDGSACLNRSVSVLETDDLMMPLIPKEKYDIIYICSPSNPTGICFSKEELSKWVKYANENNSIILYDNVYTAFIESKSIPRSIYEIEGSKKCCIEFRSFSKNASFTGVRCSYYIIPNDINSNINNIWKKRVINRFNGADYIAQRGAEAVYLKESKKLINNNIKYYKNNSKLLREFLDKYNFEYCGGIDSPYIWVKIKEHMSSIEYFKLMMNKLDIIIVPGIIFGLKGNKFFRISSLANKDIIKEAIKRLEAYYGEEKNL